MDLRAKGMPEQAVAQLKRAVEVTNGETFFVAALGTRIRRRWQSAPSGKILQTLSDRAKKSYVSPFDLALIHAALAKRTRHLRC